MTRGSVQQEDIAIINIYVPNIVAPKYEKQILTNLKRNVDSSTIIEDFNTTHPSFAGNDWFFRKSIRKLGLAIWTLD